MTNVPFDFPFYDYPYQQLTGKIVIETHQLKCRISKLTNNKETLFSRYLNFKIKIYSMIQNMNALML